MKTKTIYYCHQCKKITNEVKEIFFVEQNRYRGFCSEDCIVAFFAPIVEYLKKEEILVRRNLNIKEDFPFSGVQYEKIIEHSLKNFTEMWVGGEELSEEFCYIISRFIPAEVINDKGTAGIGTTATATTGTGRSENPMYCIVVSLLFENTPSFVLTEVVTRSEVLVDFYRKGKLLNNLVQIGGEIDNASNDKTIEHNIHNAEMPKLLNDELFSELPPEVISILENKRQNYVDDMAKNRSVDDIRTEDFYGYEAFLAETLELPDEVYKSSDREKDLIFTYIRSYCKDSLSFYFIAICMHYQMNMESDDGILIPIFFFPTTDPDLYKKYKQGEKIGGSAIN